MKIREITLADLPALATLLTEGFPSKTLAYWKNALNLLATRPKVGDLPQFGLALEMDNALQGVMLMIARDTGAAVFCNLSSWYIRPDLRKYAPLLFQRSLRFKEVNYTDCSPAAHVLPIVEKFGFQPYTAGTVLLDARAILRPGPPPPVVALTTAALNQLDPGLRTDVTRHLDYGCQGFLLRGQQGQPIPVLYRKTRLKRLVSAARFVLGDPQHLVAQAPGLARALLRRGVPIMLVDWPQGITQAAGILLPRYGVRYSRAETHPDAGDLRDTEIGVFGF